MKAYTNVSRKITENDNFIVTINEQLSKNQTVAMFFDDYANYRIGGLPNTTATEVLGHEWPAICIYSATLNRSYQSWQIVATPEQTEQQIMIRNLRKGGVMMIPQGEYVELYLEIKEVYRGRNYRFFVSTKNKVICEQHGELIENQKPDVIVKANSNHIICPDEIRDLISRHL